jgi:V/A-type H+-transporting ATPase subunit I
MIVPMKKVTLVVLDREREAALRALRALGVLHVEKGVPSGQGLADLNSELSTLDQAMAVLSEAVPKNAKGKDACAHQDADDESAQALVREVLALRDERRSAQETVSSVTRELDRLGPWGSVDPESLDYLAERGIFLFPFEMSVAEYTSLPESVRSIVVNRDKKAMRVLIWGESDLLHADMPAGAKELVLPAVSTAELERELAEANSALPRVQGTLMGLSSRLAELTAYRERLLSRIEFESIRSSMPDLDLSSARVAYLTGFAPAGDVESIRKAAREHGWAMISSDPSSEDAVPTKIHNNRIVNLISPLMDFLGTVPGYREIDISLWFLLFFGIFFAMIFGDAGYGALLSLIAAFSIFKSSRGGKKPATALFMMLYLGLMTVAWGTLTCTWFGLPVSMVPSSLVTISLPAFSSANPASADNIKVFCFTLGLIQISLAHVIGIVNNRRSLKLLGELGALMMTVGMYFVVLNLVVSAERYPLSDVVLGLVGFGFFLNFVFINYAGSVGGGVLESLKNFITMFLGIVNMFGDIMSYIRLWAVGLAGSALSATVNSMAGPFLGGFIVFAGVLLLFFGHGLNLVMNVLSVIVHGVRLNTLEFSNHLGLTWSGFKYEPFAETVKK